MIFSIITKKDLQVFKAELLAELRGHPKNSEIPEKKWLTTDEVKKLLKISETTIKKFRLDGTLPSKRLGRTNYYDFNQVKKFSREM